MEAVKRCEQITLDFERSKFQRLSVKDRLDIRMHLAMCKKCRRYAKDSKKMDLWLERRFQLSNPEFQFTPTEKEELKSSLMK